MAHIAEKFSGSSASGKAWSSGSKDVTKDLVSLCLVTVFFGIGFILRLHMVAPGSLRISPFNRKKKVAIILGLTFSYVPHRGQIISPLVALDEEKPLFSRRANISSYHNGSVAKGMG